MDIPLTHFTRKETLQTPQGQGGTGPPPRNGVDLTDPSPRSTLSRTHPTSTPDPPWKGVLRGWYETPETKETRNSITHYW